MTRICVIGDSHIGPLKYALSQGTLQQGDHATFFACHVRLLPDLVGVNHSLVAVTQELQERFRQFSGGLDRIDVDQYDRFILIGHGLWLGATLYFYSNFVSDSMPGPIGQKYLLSDHCYVEISEEVTSKCESLRVAKLIRAMCDKPITVIASPNPGFGLAEEEFAEWYPPCHAALRNGDDRALAEIFCEACARISKKHSLKVIPPIPDVAANGLFNLREYSSLPVDLEAHPDIDRMNAVVHASDHYGMHLLKYIFEDEKS